MLSIIKEVPIEMTLAMINSKHWGNIVNTITLSQYRDIILFICDVKLYSISKGRGKHSDIKKAFDIYMQKYNLPDIIKNIEYIDFFSDYFINHIVNRTY